MKCYFTIKFIHDTNISHMKFSIYGKWIMWNFKFIYEITNFIYELKISYMNLRFHMWFDFIYGNFICEISISHIKFPFHIWKFPFHIWKFPFRIWNLMWNFRKGGQGHSRQSGLQIRWDYHENKDFPLVQLVHLVQFLPHLAVLSDLFPPFEEPRRTSVLQWDSRGFLTLQFWTLSVKSQM